MATTQVLTALEKLHKELEQLEPAIRHIEAAKLVTEEVKKIPGLQQGLLQELKVADLQYKDELNKILSREITKHIEVGHKITEEVKEIPRLHTSFIQEIKSTDVQYKEDLKALLENEVSALIVENRELLRGIDSLYSTTLSSVDIIKSLVEDLRQFQNKVNSIDFPERLQQIESAAKATVEEIEKSRRATVRELSILTKQVADVDFAGNFEELKRVINNSSESNKIVVETLKKQDIPRKLVEFQSVIQARLHKDLSDLTDLSQRSTDDTRSFLRGLDIQTRFNTIDSFVSDIQDTVNFSAQDIKIANERVADLNIDINIIKKELFPKLGAHILDLKNTMEDQNKAIQSRQSLILLLLILSMVGTATGFFLLAFF